MSEIGVIHTEHIKKYYIMGDVEVRALNDITLDIYKGELAAIMGPSGSGKSTLMNILGCLDRPTDGIYKLGGELVSNMNDSQLADVRNRKIGFVFQSFNLLPRSTALENVLLPTLYSKNKANAKQRAIDALELVGLGSRLNHKPKEMSGGQQQRVAIARALINDPEIIMADEPTGNLDSKSGKEIMELLIRLNKEQGKTIILVTHDPKIGRQVPRVISVFDGMLGSEEEQAELKRWTDVNYSKLDGLANDKAALGDDSSKDTRSENRQSTESNPADSHTTKKQSKEDQPAESKPTDSQSSGGQKTASESSGYHSTRKRSSKSQPVESQPTDSQSSESQKTVSELSGYHSTRRRSSKSQSTDSQLSENKSSVSESSENNNSSGYKAPKRSLSAQYDTNDNEKNGDAYKNDENHEDEKGETEE